MRKKATIYFNELKQLIPLAVPVIISNVMQTVVATTDIIMSGKISPTDTAAVAAGAALLLPLIMLGCGILAMLVPIISHINGAKKYHLVGKEVSQVAWLALLFSLMMMIVISFSKPMFDYFNPDPMLSQKAFGYVQAIMWGMPALFLFQVMRYLCEGFSKTLPGMVFSFIGLLLNIPLNYIFIYGKWGMPQLGGIGCGVGSAITYWIMALSISFYVKKKIWSPNFYDGSSLKPQWHALKRLIKLGAPSGSALFFEASLFAGVALLLGRLGSIAVASHSAALNFSSTMFVIPVGISIAVNIRVGYHLGRESVAAAKLTTYASLLFGMFLSICTATFTIFFRDFIATFYNKDPVVVILIAQLMLFSAIFQIFDGIQAISAGVLRGYKNTRPIFFITLFSYWIIGLPLGYLLALTDYVIPPLGPVGFWIGFVVALVIAATLFLWRIYRLHQQDEETILHLSNQ